MQAQNSSFFFDEPGTAFESVDEFTLINNRFFLLGRSSAVLENEKLVLNVFSFSDGKKWNYKTPISILDIGAEKFSAFTVDNNSFIYIISSVYSRTGDWDLLLIKLDADGNEVNRLVYNFLNRKGYYDTPKDVIVDQNGNIYVSATSKKGITFNEPIYDLYIAKFNQSFSLEWAFTYRHSGAGYGDGGFSNIVITQTGKIAFSGWYEYKRDNFGLVGMLDQQGRLIWIKEYEVGTKVISLLSDKEDNVYIAGTLNSEILDFGFIVYVDTYSSNGILIWTQEYFSNRAANANSEHLAWKNKNIIFSMWGTQADTLALAQRFLNPGTGEETKKSISLFKTTIKVSRFSYINNAGYAASKQKEGILFQKLKQIQ